MRLNDLRVYFCTGARNHDLLPLFEEKNLFFEIDERIASFKALGESKITKTPTVICTTSGTAVSECLSSIIEAYYSNLPLILISGDRPKKMHGTGAPQTIDHQKITHGHVRTYLELTINELKEFNFHHLKYPVHLNILIDDTTNHDLEIKYHEHIQAFESFLTKVKSPLFLLSHETSSMREFAKELKKRKLNFHAESLSGARDLSIFNEKSLVKHFDEFDSVIRIGHTPLSKLWRLLEKKPKPVFHFDERNLPALSFGEVISLGSSDLLQNKDFFQILDKTDFNLINPIDKKLPFEKFPLSELSLLKMIHDLIPEDEIIYLGNSLSIRYFELIQTKNFNIFGNRGVNGIDGQLATAIGMARAQNKNIYAILGDLTTFYDLSALQSMPENLKLIIMNNFGGQIFHDLKLDERITLSHKNNFEKIADAFHLHYTRDISQLKNNQIIEVFSNRTETDLILGEIS